MKSIGFDLRALQYGFKAHKNRGIGVYTDNVIRRRHLAPEGLLIAPFYDTDYEAIEPLKLNARPFDPGWARKFQPFIKDYIWSHFFYKNIVDSTVKRAGVEAIFFPSHLDTPAGLKVPYCVTVHDLISVALKDHYSRSVKRKAHVKTQLAALKGARLILADSEHTKHDVVRFAHVNPSKVTVVYLGVDPEFKPEVSNSRERLDLPEKFILYVGGIDWRKNISLLFKAFSGLLKKRPDYHLVMTGEIENDPSYQNFLQSLKERSLESKVHTLGFVSRADLVKLYNHAAVFFYPSVYEGFGLPVLEAMACGAPVITTNRTSIPEVAGDAALSLDPDDPESFIEALIRVVESDSERKKLSCAGLARAAMFSWDKCAKLTYEALMSAG